MEEIKMNNTDLGMAYKAADYYENPQAISYYDKQLIFEAIAKNSDIHFVALKINLSKWRSKK